MSNTLQDAPRPPQHHAAAAIHGLHHMAWRCRDAEETRHFYEDLLGLPLFHIIQSDHVPSTGEYCPYTHIFFRLGDGSFVAFFDLGDDVAPAPSPNTPAWVNHLALRVDSLETLERTKTRLEASGIEVLGVTDHRIFKSIYFFDPNGIRLELCAQIASEPQMIEESRTSHEQLARWTARKQRWRADRIEGQASAAARSPDTGEAGSGASG
jgi:glyoxylase I family protein